MTARIVDLMLREPVRMAELCTAVGSLVVTFGADEALIGAAGLVLTALLELVRAAVSPVRVERADLPDPADVSARIEVDPESVARAVSCCLDVRVDGQRVGSEPAGDH